VALDSGEMSYATFNYETAVTAINTIIDSSDTPISKVSKLQELLGDTALPQYLVEFIKANVTDSNIQIMMHKPLSIAGMKDADQAVISRKKGFMGGANFTGHPEVAHHVRVHYNAKGIGRVFYKYVAGVVFLKNVKAAVAS
jgi:hypothetical protein